MNYAQLVTEVQGYLENTFATNDMNTCIQQAEERIYNLVQFPALRKNVVGTTTPNLPYLACPNDFLATYSMASIDPVTGAYTFLLNKDVNFLREAYPSPASIGPPRFYALFGPQSNAQNELTFMIGPTPDQVYNIELHYFFYPFSITDAINNPSGVTWLADNFPPVLLYGTLVEAYIFLKGEKELIDTYDAKFKEAVVLAKRMGDGMERQDAYRSGQYRQQVG